MEVVIGIIDLPPKSMLKNTGFPGASLKLAEALMFSGFFENNPMCQMKRSQFHQQTSQHQGSRSYHPAKSSQKLPGQLEKPR